MRCRFGFVAGAWRSLALLALVLVAFGLRVHLLGEADVWWDEGFSAWVARQQVPALLIETAYDTHPPFYYLLLHWWMGIAGDGEFSLRFPSLFFGVLLVPLVYSLGRQFGFPPAAVLAASFVAASRFLVDWSQQARMYTLATALGLLSTSLALSELRSLRRLAAYVVTTSLLLHTFYLGAVFLLLQALCLVFRRRAWACLRRWLLAQLLVSASLVPWLALFLPRMRSWSIAEPMSFGRFMLQYWSVVVTGTAAGMESLWRQLVPAGLLLAVSTAAFASSCRLGRQRMVAFGQLLALALVPPIAVYLLSRPRPFFYSPRPEPRYLHLFMPFLYLFWAAGLAELWRLSHAAGGLLSLACLALVASGLPAVYSERIHQDRYSSLACTLEAYRRQNEPIILHNDHDWPVFSYYYRGAWLGVPNAARWDDAGAAAFLTRLVGEQKAAWLVTTDSALQADPSRAIERWLRAWCGSPCEVTEWRFGATRLTRFGRASSLPSPGLAQALPAPGGGALLAYWAASRRVAAGQRWDVFLWHKSSPEPVRLICRGEAVEPSMILPEPSAAGGLRRTMYRFYPPEPGRCLFLVGNRALLSLRVLPSAKSNAPGVEQMVPLGAEFGGAIALDGYWQSSTTAAPGAELCFALWWRSVRPVQTPYVVFVHLLGESFNASQGNFLWGQHDGQPAGGTRPVPSWRQGEEVIDRHCFRVLPQAPPGRYLVEVGLYDATTGERLPVTMGGEGDRIIISEISVLTQ